MFFCSYIKFQGFKKKNTFTRLNVTYLYSFFYLNNYHKAYL